MLIDSIVNQGTTTYNISLADYSTFHRYGQSCVVSENHLL
jgi:hypothetical protein